jgi:hypothetical protein
MVNRVNDSSKAQNIPAGEKSFEGVSKIDILTVNKKNIYGELGDLKVRFWDKPIETPKPRPKSEIKAKQSHDLKEYSFTVKFPGGKGASSVKISVSEILETSGPQKGKLKEVQVAVENAAGSKVLMNQTQLEKMKVVVKDIITVSREKGFEPTIALAIAADESRLGIGVQESAQDPYTNPMQLTSGSGKRPVKKETPNARQTNIGESIEYIMKDLAKGGKISSMEDLKKMLAAYRIGPTKVRENGLAQVFKNNPGVKVDVDERLAYLQDIANGTGYVIPK